MFESITSDEGVYTVQGSVLLKFSNGRDKMENLMRFIEGNFNVLNTKTFDGKSSMWRAFNGELWKEFNGETSTDENLKWSLSSPNTLEMAGALARNSAPYQKLKIADSKIF